jgi:hypothetical protein
MDVDETIRMLGTLDKLLDGFEHSEKQRILLAYIFKISESSTAALGFIEEMKFNMLMSFADKKKLMEAIAEELKSPKGGGRP